MLLDHFFRARVRAVEEGGRLREVSLLHPSKPALLLARRYLLTVEGCQQF
jgi:hypothetical protein